MAKRRSFVPESPAASTLEGRVVLSTSWGDVGHWFSSQYHHVTDDLGISHKKSNNAAAGIEKLRQQAANATPKPSHAKPFIQVSANDTVKS